MWANIDYLSTLAPNLHIDVITSSESKELIEKISSSKVSHFRYGASTATEDLLSSLEIDFNYRSGFWRYSLERLIALTEHHANFPTESLLHIESDVLLLKSFPFEIFEKIQQIGWSPFEKDRDVASLIYLPSSDLSLWLHAQLIEFIGNDLARNDMDLLSLLSKNFDQSILCLPIAPSPQSVAYSRASSPSGYDRLRCSKLSEEFEGVFDGAAIGIWLTGTHPVNAFGISKRYDTKLIHETKSYVDPSKINFQFSEDDGLFWVEDERRINVHTLHIHSKNVDFFSLENSKLISKCVSDSRKGKVTTDFYLSVFLRSIEDNWKKGTLLRYLSWLPGIRKLKVLWSKFHKFS
jgi:hypothetical protein